MVAADWEEEGPAGFCAAAKVARNAKINAIGRVRGEVMTRGAFDAGGCLLAPVNRVNLYSPPDFARRPRTLLPKFRGSESAFSHIRKLHGSESVFRRPPGSGTPRATKSAT